MSWEVVNQIVARALIDTRFAQNVLTDAPQAIKDAGFELTLEEQQVFQDIKARDIPELAQILLKQLGPEDQ